MFRRVSPALAAGSVALGIVAVALVAGGGFDATQPGSFSSLLVAAIGVAALAAATTRLRACVAAEARPARAQQTRDAWLLATIAQSATHADARALMRPRPPSAAR